MGVVEPPVVPGDRGGTRERLNSAKPAYPFLAAAALGQARNAGAPYRRYAGTLTYGRALMGRASRENISCRGLRWDIFPLRSDYGSTSMAWVGLLKWAIYMWHSLLQV